MSKLKTNNDLKFNHFNTLERILLRILASGDKTAEEMLTAIYEARGVILLSGNFYGYIKALMKYGFVEKVKERGTFTVYRLTKEGKKETLKDAERELAAAQRAIDVLHK